MRLVASLACALLVGCATPAPVIDVPPDIVELPPRPQPPQVVTNQRQVAEFLVALSAYADELEARLRALRPSSK